MNNHLGLFNYGPLDTWRPPSNPSPKRHSRMTLKRLDRAGGCQQRTFASLCWRASMASQCCEQRTAYPGIRLTAWTCQYLPQINMPQARDHRGQKLSVCVIRIVTTFRHLVQGHESANQIRQATTRVPLCPQSLHDPRRWQCSSSAFRSWDVLHSNLFKTKLTFVPPKPKLFDWAYCNEVSRADVGT